MYAFRREAAVFHDLTLHSEVLVWPYSSLQRSSRRKTMSSSSAGERRRNRRKAESSEKGPQGFETYD
tara:strand:- start:331 stop:531 length:201 start_codon:yes stop_codon:yes gene_type:complete